MITKTRSVLYTPHIATINCPAPAVNFIAHLAQSLQLIVAIMKQEHAKPLHTSCDSHFTADD